jgi:hypothetical protein
MYVCMSVAILAQAFGSSAIAGSSGQRCLRPTGRPAGRPAARPPGRPTARLRARADGRPGGRAAAAATPAMSSLSAGLNFADVPSGIAAASKIPMEGLRQILVFAGVIETHPPGRPPARPWARADGAAGRRQILVFAGVIETHLFKDKSFGGPGFAKYGAEPGNFGTGYWGRKIKDPAEHRNKLTIELNNGRLAMSSVTSMRIRNDLTGQSAIDQLTTGHISPFNDGQGLLATYDVSKELGACPPHGYRDPFGMTAFQAIQEGSLIIFFSHQWLSLRLPDPRNLQFEEMAHALNEISQEHRVRPDQIYTLVDYSSMPQTCPDMQLLAIQSLVAYAAASTLTVIICPSSVHMDFGTVCNFDTYAKRFWCRVEVFCTVVSTIHMNCAKKEKAIQEEVDNQGDVRGGREDDEQPLSEEVTINDMNELCRVFRMTPATEGSKTRLQQVLFFNSDGSLRKGYEGLFYIWERDLECCRRGHKTQNGQEATCDKHRLVPIISGLYGAMVEDYHKMKKTQSSDSPVMLLVEKSNKMRSRMFPVEFFDTRIEAIREFLEPGVEREEEELQVGHVTSCVFSDKSVDSLIEIKLEHGQALHSGENSSNNSIDGLSSLSGPSVSTYIPHSALPLKTICLTSSSDYAMAEEAERRAVRMAESSDGCLRGGRQEDDE